MARGTLLGTTIAVVWLVATGAASAAVEVVEVGKNNLNTFTPAKITISPGDSIRWQWVSGAHTTTRDGADGWDQEISAVNQTYERPFPNAGTFTYYCKPHKSFMTGEIVVQSASPPSNQAPSASFTYSPAQPTVGQTVTFDGSASSDTDGTVGSWQWDLDGDGAYEVQTPTPTTSRSYDTAGTRTVRLRVTDDDGAQSAVASRTLTVAASSGGSTPTPEGGEESPRTGGDQPPSSGGGTEPDGDGLEPEPIGTPLPSEEAASPAVSGPRKVGSVRPSRRGVVRIPRLRAKCPVGDGRCKLDVRLRAMPPRKRARTVGKRRKPLAAGRSAKVAVRLSRAGRRLLNRHRKVRGRATVRLSRPGAPTAVKKTKLKLVRRAR